MTLRPVDLIDDRPDNRIDVERVFRAQGISQFAARPNERLRIFGGIFSEDVFEYPWARPPLEPGEEMVLRDFSPTLDPLQQGREVSFDDPMISPPGLNLEVVQFYVNMTGSTRIALWGRKPSIEIPDTIPEVLEFGFDKDDFELIGPVWASGGQILNEERPAEPTDRQLFDPGFVKPEPVAASIKHMSPADEPLRGKCFVAMIERHPDDLELPDTPEVFNFRDTE